MNKKDAAEYLGISPRVLARYVEQGRLSVTYIEGKNGREARYDAEELQRLKEQKSAPIHRPIAIRGESLPSGDILSDPERLQRLFEAFSPKKRPLLITEIACKITLRVEEASLISGFSQNDILSAIHRGELPAKKKGSWRIKRDDLDRWITGMDFSTSQG